ncbi:hypothetical protein D3C73_1454310 [compost metagenome]
MVLHHQTQPPAAHIAGDVPLGAQQHTVTLQRPVQGDLTVVATQGPANLDALGPPAVVEVPYTVGRFVLSNENAVMVLQVGEFLRGPMLIQINRRSAQQASV